MATTNGFHLFDYGIPIRVQLLRKLNGQPLDVSLATSLQFVFSKPSGKGTLQRSATRLTDGSDGQVYYVWQAGELDTKGTWKVQVYIVFGSFKLLHSDQGTFSVGDILAK
jgi:predicted ABC-type transport system involved in lysophospholipase L1 biosynthesis ATPase subunit